MKIRKRNNKRKRIKKRRSNIHEQIEKTLNHISPLFGCEYIKIPDVTKKTMAMIRKYKRYDLKPKKRPFDGILVTPNNTFCIEVKVQYDKLKDHQSDWQRKVNKVNNCFIVLRRKELKLGIKYIIEHKGREILEIDSIEEVIKSLKNYKI